MTRSEFSSHVHVGMSSDLFFKQNGKTYDVIFIDGLHTEEQVLKDVTNALKFLNKNGTIVLHDCVPENEFMQRNIPKDDGQGPWTGTVWRAFVYLRMTRSDLAMAVVDCDFGVGLIRRGYQAVYETDNEINYALFEKDKKTMLNLIPPEELNEWLAKTGER